jgi:hypothetical protein
MKNTIKLGSIIIGLVASTLTGCKRGDDLYINPNAPAEVTPALLLTAIEVATFNSYEGNLVKNSSILIQQNAGVEGQMYILNNYILPENEYDNQWGQLYQTLYACKDLKTKYGADNPHYAGIANILAAMNWGLLTDMWGDIPYSEALQGGENYQAKYDAQEKVMTGILNMLDEAIELLDASVEENEILPGSDDLIYQGDAAAWKRVAYSLKARYLNRLSNKASYNPTEILSCIANGISSSDEDFVSIHGVTSVELNQWYDFQNNRAFYVVAGLPFVDSLKLRPTDSRLYEYFDSTGFGDVVGSPIDATTADASPWGDYLCSGGDKSVRLISFTEMKFIEAEVKTRQGDATAADVLNDAIRSSCLTVTEGAYDGSDIATYTASNVNLSRVIYEKWLAMFGSAEPYNDYRRTGFPVLRPNANGRLSEIPKRYPTPQAERVSNPNAPVPSLTTPVWWAQ